jgi:hypothetical protein
MLRINTEIITGIALIFLATLFMYGSLFFRPWAVILIVDYVLIAIGGGFIALGVWTLRNYEKERTEKPSHH